MNVEVIINGVAYRQVKETEMDKKLTPIWDELSAIGEAAPPGTWDAVPTNLSTINDRPSNPYSKQIENVYENYKKVDDLIADVMLKHPSQTARGVATYFENVHQELAPLARKLEAENEALKLAHARYECVRRLSPRAFTELWKANVMRNEGTFDDLVDRLIKNQPLGGLPK